MVARSAGVAVGAAAAALVGAGLGSLASSGAAATAAGLLVLVLPGPVVAEAVMRFRNMTSVERIGWWVAAQFVTLIASGLVLAQFSAVTRTGWLWTLAAVTCIAALAVVVRSRGASSSLVGRRADRTTAARNRSRLLAAVVAASTALVAAAVVVSVDSARSEPTPAFTELWLLPASHSDDVVIGIRSHENHAVTYRLDVAAGGRTVRTWNVTLQRGGEWERRSTAPSSEQVVARLYLSGSSAAYRTVSLAAGQRPGVATSTDRP
jgi:uncharacterized membrane protein